MTVVAAVWGFQVADSRCVMHLSWQIDDSICDCKYTNNIWNNLKIMVPGHLRIWRNPLYPLLKYLMRMPLKSDMSKTTWRSPTK